MLFLIHLNFLLHVEGHTSLILEDVINMFTYALALHISLNQIWGLGDSTSLAIISVVLSEQFYKWVKVYSDICYWKIITEQSILK